MDYSEFISFRGSSELPSNLHPLLRALLIEAAGDWDTAHSIAQDDTSNDGSWVHAYLHRVEGDRWNANYCNDNPVPPTTKKSCRYSYCLLISIKTHLKQRDFSFLW